MTSSQTAKQKIQMIVPAKDDYPEILVDPEI